MTTPTMSRRFVVAYGPTPNGLCLLPLGWMPWNDAEDASESAWAEGLDAALVEHGLSGAVAFSRYVPILHIAALVASDQAMASHPLAVGQFISSAGQAAADGAEC